MACLLWSGVVVNAGTLCVFSSRAFTMEQWMALETATAYAVTCA